MEELKIGVYVCNCGTNIAHVVDAESVRNYAATLPGVEVARSYRYMCSNPGQEMIVEDIREPGAEPRRGRRLQPAHARAHLPQRLPQPPASIPTCARWPTSASSAAGCTPTAWPRRRRPWR